MEELPPSPLPLSIEDTSQDDLHQENNHTNENESGDAENDIEVVDGTDVFHRVMMDWVDVRDYGAMGDGVTDDSAAFLLADAAAAGRDTNDASSFRDFTTSATRPRTSALSHRPAVGSFVRFVSSRLSGSARYRGA